MNSFAQFNLPDILSNAINDLGFEKPTPMQEKAYPAIRSGKDIVGVAQTGTGKTLAYLLPILRDIKFSKQNYCSVVILVPTRELVMQVVSMAEELAKYMTIRVLGIYGGRNINKQKEAVVEGMDILVATPARLYDIALTGVLRLKGVKKFVIDEVDVMLDEGFRPQLNNILEILPPSRQNIMFSATMSKEVDLIIDEYFALPTRISIGLSGTPLANIQQSCYSVPNFHTKVNLLSVLLANPEIYTKVLVFVSGKKIADRLFTNLEEQFSDKVGVIHGSKSQNFRINSITRFEEGTCRILVATDVMSRGLDFTKISHVINFDTPDYPENYIHRIGRTGRAEEKGQSILFFTEKEKKARREIERLMDYQIPLFKMPEDVRISHELIPEERPKQAATFVPQKKDTGKGAAFHEKKDKNKKTNQGGSYLRKKKKYKKPKTKGDKIINQRKSKRK